MVFDNDSEQVLRLHLKVMQIGREGWVVVPQLAVGVHDLCPPLQKQRIPAYYPVHHNASEKNSVFNSTETEHCCRHPWRVPNQTKLHPHTCTIGHHKLHCIQATDFVPILLSYGSKLPPDGGSPCEKHPCLLQM